MSLKNIIQLIICITIPLACDDTKQADPDSNLESLAGEQDREMNSTAGDDASQGGESMSVAGNDNIIDESVIPTYYGQIKAIIDTHCAHCHSEGGAGLLNLNGYEQAKTWGQAILGATQSLRMPPWGAYETDDCQPSRPWKEDQRLSPEQLEILAQWVEADMPAGNPDDVVNGERFVNRGLERVDFEGSAQFPIEVEPGDDAFICVVIDPEIEEETWLKGVAFEPDNEQLVHHIVLFSDPSRASLELMDENGTYPCFGSSLVPGSVTAAWAPGIQPSILPEDHAMRIKPGTLFVMQMHYSPQGGAGELSDQTHLRFQYADESPTREAYLQLMGNLDFTIHPAFGLQAQTEDQNTQSPEFVIPANAENHREVIRWTYAGDLPGGPDGSGGVGALNELKLISIAPHMHYAGVDMQVHIDRPAPEEAACEPGSLSAFFTCANSAGCLDSNDTVACIQSECSSQWDALSLTCWGCAHRVFTAGGSQVESIAQIAACERKELIRSTLAQPTNECLVSAPMYDFEWQRSYAYDVPIEDLPSFVPGDIITINCGYDNSMNNANMRGALNRAGLSETINVNLGDETLDEMCLVGLLFSFERSE